MKRVIAIALVLMLVPVAAEAVWVSETCYNETHVLMKYDFELSVDADTTAYNYTQLFHCTYNCTNATNTCAGTLRQGDMTGIVASAIGMAVAFLYMSVKVGEEHGALQTLFSFIGLILFINASGLIHEVAEAQGAQSSILSQIDNITWVLAIVFLVFTFYFMVVLLKSVLTRMKPEGGM